MDRERLLRLPAAARPNRGLQSQPTPTWIVIALLTVVALDICILADLLTENSPPATCSLKSVQGDCPEPPATHHHHHHHQYHRIQQNDDDACFRAAVFENNRIDSPDDLGERIQRNLGLYDRAAKLASQNGATMIVYPEDGLYMGTRRQVEPHLQQVPDPESLSEHNNNPCLRPDQFGAASEILTNLSCIARENRLYVIANFGTRQECEPYEQVADRQCPEKGFFSLNTDVVLDPEGNFIKRYRKYNLFIEIFDHPPALEEVHFDTPFGRFGLFTCFDIIFERPAVDLVEKHKVDTILFPTWWYDEAPILTATLSQEAWSRGNQVNLLAANMFRRGLGSVGSGIYSGDSMVYTTASSSNAKLLVANVAKNPKNSTCASENFHPISIEIETGYPVDEYRNKNYELQKSDILFSLQQLEAKKTICSGQVCCTIDYKINPNSVIDQSSLSRMVLVARDTNRAGQFKFYEQVCLLATLEEPIRPDRSLNETVVIYAREPLVAFEKLSIKGSFETSHVYPFAGHLMTQPMEREGRHFECHELTKQLTRCEHSIAKAKPQLDDKKIYSFGLYGRMYRRDIMPEGWNW